MSNSKETMTKKQQDDLASTFNNLPWGLPLGFPSVPPFGAFPSFALPTPNFSSLNNFSSSTATNFPISSLLSNDSTSSTTAPTADFWSNGLSTAANPNIDYNEYIKQLGLLMNTLSDKSKQSEMEKPKSSSVIKSSKSKQTSSSATNNGKISSSKHVDDSHPRPTSTSSSSTSSRRSSSNHLMKSSSSNSKSTPTKSSTTTTTNDLTLLDPLAFANAAATGGLTFPYFLPSLLSQSTGTTTNSSSTYPFSSVSSLLNPTASLYPFFSPDWFTSSSKFMEGFPNLTTDKSMDSKDSTSQSTSKPKQSQKHITPENKHLPSLNSLLNETPSSSSSSSSKSKKRAKSIRTLTEEQDKNTQIRKSTAITNPSLLHTALMKSSNDDVVLSSTIDSNSFLNQQDTWTLKTTDNTKTNENFEDSINTQTADESKSNDDDDDDDSDPNPKRRKTEDINEALIGIPLARRWKRITIVRAITRTGVRGDVFYYAPCGRKLRSFQEIDRYLSKKNITDLDRSYFTFSSKVHLGHFHEPKEGPNGKTIFQEFTEEEIFNRILEINPKFRRNKIEYENETSIVSSRSITPNQNNNNNGTSDFIQQIFEENQMAKRDTKHLLGESPKTNLSYQHNDFFKAMIDQQEQERKRQELVYFKQIELKKRQEDKLLLIEQRKVEKHAEREKKIQEKYMEIVLAKEKKRIVEDMQLRDLKPLPNLKPVENSRLSIESFANSLMIIQFLNNFKHILHIPDNLIPTLNTLQSSSSTRDLNSLCQLLLNLALDDPGIPNPKKGLTNLGQKLSEIDITEHTFSEILRLYIRERNGFDDKLTQTLAETSFQTLIIDEKIEILAFLCNDLATNKRIVEEVDRNIDELTILKHEKLEIEKRLRRLKIDKSNQLKKPLTTSNRDKDLNSSENESPNESDHESTKNDDETSMINDPAAIIADDQDIETLDETKIDDLDKRLTLVTRKYLLIKRRVIDKHSRTRALHLGQDRYRRRYWHFSHIPGIFIEGLTTGDISADEIKDIVEYTTKQKLDKTEENLLITKSTQRKKQLTKSSLINSTNDLFSFCKDESISDENLPLDLSCSKSKRLCDENYWISQTKAIEQLNEIKQENILNLNNSNNHYEQIEQTIQERFQYAQPLSIPEDLQSGWWIIQTSDELKTFLKSLAKRGQRERYLCRMLQRYFDILIQSMSNTEIDLSSPLNENLTENNNNNNLEENSSNDYTEMTDETISNNIHEMDILNEIYNLSDRIISSSLHCRSYDHRISRKRLTYSDIQSKGSDILDEAKHLLTEIERNIERRYLKHPFVRKYEINLSSINRINQNNTYHHTNEDSTNELTSSSQYDEVPQQLERWRRTIYECRTPAQLALCLNQLERCIAWERSIMRVFCEICNCDNEEEKLLLCDGCDHGTHTFCFLPPMSFIPPNDWYCYVCIGKAKGENLCFVCGIKGELELNRCEHCGKYFHEHCLKNAKFFKGKWFCVLCAENEVPNNENGTVNTKNTGSRQTSRSITNRNRSNLNRKSKTQPNTDILLVQESHSDSSHGDTTTTSNALNDSIPYEMIEDDNLPSSPIINSKKKSSKTKKVNNDMKSCRLILNELLKSDVSWPFQMPVDSREHPKYYQCITHPIDLSIIKKKMRTNQYTKREEFLHDIELLLSNCQYFNEDDSPVGQAGTLLRALFQAQWDKVFG